MSTPCFGAPASGEELGNLQLRALPSQEVHSVCWCFSPDREDFVVPDDDSSLLVNYLCAMRGSVVFFHNTVCLAALANFKDSGPATSTS